MSHHQPELLDPVLTSTRCPPAFSPALAVFQALRHADPRLVCAGCKNAVWTAFVAAFWGPQHHPPAFLAAATATALRFANTTTTTTTTTTLPPVAELLARDCLLPASSAPSALWAALHGVFRLSDAARGRDLAEFLQLHAQRARGGGGGYGCECVDDDDGGWLRLLEAGLLLDAGARGLLREALAAVLALDQDQGDDIEALRARLRGAAPAEAVVLLWEFALEGLRALADAS